MDSDNNDSLFEKAQNGDFVAFEAFIRSYEGLIYNSAYRMFSNKFDAQDISQEVLIKVYRNLGNCKSYPAFKSWLFRIINNTCIDELRKRKGKNTYSLDAPLETDEGLLETQILKDENTPETALIKKEDGKEIKRAIGSLSPEYRMIIILRDINGLSYDEIAKILKINIGTVKSRISRARSYVKQELKKSAEQNK
jgi:RNA polymerase sigma-70 factor (ECF subfamily)